jgi:hypothetical protein
VCENEIEKKIFYFLFFFFVLQFSLVVTSMLRWIDVILCIMWGFFEHLRANRVECQQLHDLGDNLNKSLHRISYIKKGNRFLSSRKDFFIFALSLGILICRSENGPMVFFGSFSIKYYIFYQNFQLWWRHKKSVFCTFWCIEMWFWKKLFYRFC